MPISSEMRGLYPPRDEWMRIRKELLERGCHRCEGSPKFPDCRAENRRPHPVTGSYVVLTVAHLDHDPTNNGTPGNRPNLRLMCQRCHLAHDQDHHIANARRTRRGRRAAAAAQRDAEPHGELVHAACGRRGEGGGSHGCAERTGHGPADDGELVHAERARLEGHTGHGDDAVGRPLADRPAAAAGSARRALVNGFWADAEWLWCIDGRYRPAEPGTFPMAHGAAARVGRLRAYGNAIVPQVAAEFVMAFAGATNGWPRLAR